MQRYFLKLSFSGERYCGWQIQENVSNTVQQVLNETLSTLLHEHVETVGAGRTDTGVHAREFFAHFDSEKDNLHADPREWLYKFNVVLPHDIAVQQVIPVKPDAHARFSAVSRTYEYVITRRKDPFQLGRAYYLYGELDVARMNEAALVLKEYSDFSSFSKTNTQVKTNLCVLTEAAWEERNELLVLKLTANRFLRNMVRAITGTLLDVGKKKLGINDFRNIIEGKNRGEAGFSVPAHGLYLTRIEYNQANVFLQ